MRSLARSPELAASTFCGLNCTEDGWWAAPAPPGTHACTEMLDFVFEINSDEPGDELQIPGRKKIWFVLPASGLSQ